MLSKKDFRGALEFAHHVFKLFIYERRIPKRLANSRLFCSVTLLRDQLLHMQKEDSKDSETIYLYLPSFPQRYLYLVLYFFSLLGRPMKLIRNETLERYRKLLPEGRLAYKIPNLKIIKPPKRRVRAKMFVSEDFGVMPVEGIEREINISLDVSKPKDKTSMMMPYFAFPLHYHEGRMARLEEHRTFTRRVRVLFAGATWHYPGRGEAVERLFDKQPRLDALRAIRERLTPSQVLMVDVPWERQIILQGEENTQTPYVQKLLLSTAKGHPENWLSELARCDFFLSLPGIKMPLCHNAIESMAVGTVPILSCPDWFSPHLKHGYNCLTYDGEDDLIATLRQALSMDADKVAAMRKNAAQYYDEFLSPKRFMRRVMNCQCEDLVLYVNCELREIFEQVNANSILFADDVHQCPQAGRRSEAGCSAETALLRKNT